MGYAEDDSRDSALGFGFDLLIKLAYHGARILSDARLLAYRELNDVVGLTDLAGCVVGDGRRPRNTSMGSLSTPSGALFGQNWR